MAYFNPTHFSADPTVYIDNKVSERFSVSHDRMLKALNDKEIATLRNASNHFFHVSGEYRRLVEYRAYLLRNDYIIFPTVDCVAPKWKKIQNYIHAQNMKATHSEIALCVVRDGVWYGYERQLNDSIYFQTLDYNYCRSRFVINGTRAVEFDLTFFNQYKQAERLAVMNGMPEDIVAAYKRYEINKTEANRWLLLDTSVARCHMSPDGIPPLANVLLDIINLERYKQINLLDEELSVYKILIQKLPLNKENELTFLKPEIDQFHRNLRGMVKRPIDVITTPCEIDSLDLEKRAKDSGDRVDEALNIVYATAGVPMLLFNSKSGGAYALKESINVDTASMRYLQEQYESWYAQKFENMSGKGTAILQFLTTTEHNKFDMLDNLQKASSLGYPTRMMTAAVLNISHMEDLLKYENDTLNLPEEMIPTMSGYNSGMEKDGAGAPKKNEQQLSDEGLKTRVGEKNLNTRGK